MSDKIEIFFLANRRTAFRDASLDALMRHTDWRRARLVVYTDGAEFPATVSPRIGVRRWELGGPVAIMNDLLARGGTEVFAKIDDDVIVPEGWLGRCLEVMERRPELGLLGIEPPASRTSPPWLRAQKNGGPPPPEFQEHWKDYAPCDAIGGIGLMRRSAFAGGDRMAPHGPNGVGGFTDWQLRHPEVRKGWIAPPLKLFLLDRLPIEPWAALSKEYIARGWQRPWTPYEMSAEADLWGWWTKEPGARGQAAA